MISKYLKTASMAAHNKTYSGFMALLPGAFLRVVCLIPLLMLWRTLMAGGTETGMTLSQMLTYTYISAILSDLLVVDRHIDQPQMRDKDIEPIVLLDIRRVEPRLGANAVGEIGRAHV